MSQVFENVLSKVSVRPQAAAAAVNGIAVDGLGFDNAMFVVETGATTGTPTSFTFDAKVQESADGSTGWTDITGAAIVQQTAVNKSAQIQVTDIGGKTRLRYFRVVATPVFSGGTTPTLQVSAIALLGEPARGAVANSTTGA